MKRILVIGVGRRARRIAEELPAVGYRPVSVTGLADALGEVNKLAYDAVVVAPEFGMNEAEEMAHDLLVAAASHEHMPFIISFDENVEGFALGADRGCKLIDVLIGIFSMRTFEAALRSLKTKQE